MDRRPRRQSSLAALQLVQFDKISVTGGVALDGTLVVSLVNSFVPSVGNSFTIITVDR